MSEFKWDINNFDDAIEYIADMIDEGSGNKHFTNAVALATKIAENPSDYTGPQATLTAMRLAAHRTKIGIAVQFWKMKSAQTKKPHDRLIKDGMMVIYDALLELINTLKLQARHEKELVSG